MGFIVIALVLTTAGPLSAQGDAAAGQAGYAICAACHGPDGGGNAALNAPAIAGQEGWYLMRQLNNFKTGIRGGGSDSFGAMMAPMAMALATDADVANMAAYVASLTPGELPAEDGDAAAGAAHYAVCAACHGPDGKGMEAMNAPNLTIQQGWYIVRQLQNFKGGVRGAHAQDTFGAQMAPMAQMLTDEQAMKDLTAYLATLR